MSKVSTPDGRITNISQTKTNLQVTSYSTPLDGETKTPDSFWVCGLVNSLIIISVGLQ